MYLVKLLAELKLKAMASMGLRVAALMMQQRSVLQSNPMILTDQVWQQILRLLKVLVKV